MKEEKIKAFNRCKTRTERRLLVLSISTKEMDIRQMSFEKISEFSILVTFNNILGIKNKSIGDGRNYRHGRD